MRHGVLVSLVALAIGLAPAGAGATDGYFSSGYGMKALGRGGASVAVPGDAMGGANNPATMVFSGTRVDLGISLFSPDRSAARSGNAFGLNGVAHSSNSSFVIPEFGYNQMINPRLSLGVTVYGNGGMNTDYPGWQIAAGHCGPGAPAANLLCGSGKLGVNLVQLIIAPTLSYKVTPNVSVGISPLFGYQRFAVEGIQPFAAISSQPGNVTNNANNSATGAGVRVGVYWQATPMLGLGASYQSPIFMSRFTSYGGLFAEQGSFDIPQNVSLGLAIRPTAQWLIALDYERVFYSDIASIGNPSTNPALLGTNGGRGFGWQDVNVVKLGVEYSPIAALTLRAGYNHTDNPIKPRDVTFNILAPGVVTDHLSAGFTWKVAKNTDISFAYVHAFTNSVSGATSPLLPGGGTDIIKLSEDQVGLAIGITW